MTPARRKELSGWDKGRIEGRIKSMTNAAISRELHKATYQKSWPNSKSPSEIPSFEREVLNVPVLSIPAILMVDTTDL